MLNLLFVVGTRSGFLLINSDTSQDSVDLKYPYYKKIDNNDECRYPYFKKEQFNKRKPAAFINNNTNEKVEITVPFCPYCRYRSKRLDTLKKHIFLKHQA